MKRKNTTRKALLMSIMSMLLCVSMLVGTTFAWFTDEVASGVNVIAAGNLDVELEYAKVVNGQVTGWATVAAAEEIFDPNALWEPGRVEVVYLKVSNLGTLALKYQLGVNVYDETSAVNVNGEEFNLSDYLVFKAVEMPDNLTTYTDREAAQLASGTALGLNDYNGNTTALEVAGVDYVALIVYMPESVDNDANYRGSVVPTIKLGVNLVATQVEAEEDSFGSDYDKNAWHADMTVYTAEELATALENNTNVKLGADVDYNDDIVLTANLDLGGYTLSAGYVTTMGNVVVTNGALELPADRYVYAMDGASIALEDVEIISDGISAYAARNGFVSLKNVEFVNTATSNPVQNYGGTLVMENVTVAQSGDANTAWYSSAVQVINLIVKNAETGKYEITAQADTTINSGIYEGKTALFISSPGGNVTINGGTFTGTDAAINAQFAPQNYTYGANYESVITITGGTFNGALKFFPANEVIITGGNFSVDPTAYLATGYKAVLYNGMYRVVAENVYFTVEDLQDAINAATSAATFAMGADMTGDLVMRSDITIEGNGFTLNGAINLNGADNVTLKGITFDAAGAKLGYDNKNSAKQYANIITGDKTNKPNKGSWNVVIDGCTFTGTFANGGVAITFTDYYRTSGFSGNITIKNCTFDTVGAYYDIYGYYCGDSLNGRGDFVIENNVFESDDMHPQGRPIYLGRYASNVPVVVKGNTFMTKDSVGSAVTVQDHSSYGVSIDASNNTFAG